MLTEEERPIWGTASWTSTPGGMTPSGKEIWIG